MPVSHSVTVGPITFGAGLPLVIIAGPCVLESREHAMATCATLSAMARRLAMPFVYKTSFDKANRTSITGPRGAA